ncbi:hypothetical protein NO559_07695 [Dasania sp. GY-MA-18]|uniref:Phage portal protein n=1 Tax=Dasania phycosphaerae TaxID=2950436 RepID=A0A9J6RLL6_9GAMM|nr:MULTISPECIES: hypothetical protein [Dasania]MCR8922649.1 hypothetical protein [Dasania sp. GY-MA-18]MCZ0865079.1 hypothetical protein [Dasania phycosphaerae]MCZ0868805.1 hypothetical protein [Dasania phycosphaerae]
MANKIAKKIDAFLGRARTDSGELGALHAEALQANAARDYAAGKVATPENSQRYLYQQMNVDFNRRATVLDIRHMDKADGRVKKIHKKMARDITQGGLKLHWGGKENSTVIRLFKNFVQRLELNSREKLQSDARGCVMEGNLALQWVLEEVNGERRIGAGVRMPSETIVPQVDGSGRFKDHNNAYHQLDIMSSRVVAKFASWGLTIGRLDPDNYDDLGAMGRPYLDASRPVWQKLMMTEEDLVIRRRVRAPQKLSHNLRGMTPEAAKSYEEKVRNESGEIPTDFFVSGEGTVTAISGDANLEQIADVELLIDSFFSGSPAPKGLFGYVGDLPRDVLEDLKRDYYEEIDGAQDVQSGVYQRGFYLDLLLHGVNPLAYDFSVVFAERKTETRNQRADYALKLQALGFPQDMVFTAAGADPVEVRAKLEEQFNKADPYPDIYDDKEDDDQTKSGNATVNVTPGNGRKGESATTINTRT